MSAAKGTLLAQAARRSFWVLIALTVLSLPLRAQENDSEQPPDSAKKGWLHQFFYGRKYIDEEKPVIIQEPDTVFTQTVEGRVKTFAQSREMQPQKGLIPLDSLSRNRKASPSDSLQDPSPLKKDTADLLPDTTGLFYVYIYAERQTGEYFNKVPLGNVAITDGYGDFSLNVKPSDSVLVFRYKDYWLKKVRIPDNKEETIVIEEIVLPIIGDEVHLGPVREDERYRTSAVGRAKEEHFRNAQSVSFDAQMQGRVPGLQILQTTGMPGSDVLMRLRGPSSYLADSKPLVIVDGVQVNTGTGGDGGGGIGEHFGAQTNPLAHINPSDIEKVEVLKDADALAMYGSRGANGVIKVHTKRGEFGRTQFNLDYMTGPTFPTNKIDVLDAQQYRNTLDEAYRNTLRLQNDTAPMPPRSNFIFPGQVSGTLPDTAGRINNFLANSGSSSDPLEEAMQSGYVQDIGLSASGGNERVNFFFGGNFRDEQGTLKGQDFQRLSTRFNADNVAIPGRLKLGVSLGMTFTQENHVHTGLDSLGGFGIAQSRALPHFPFSHPESLGGLRRFQDNSFFDPFSGNNIGLTMDKEHIDNERQVFRNMASLYGEYNILPNLQFRADLGSDYLATTDRTFRSRFVRLNKVVDPLSSTGDDSVTVPQAFAFDAREVFFSLNYRAQLQYSTRFGKDHYLSASVGGDGIQSIHTLNASSSEDFPSDETRLVSSGSIESDLARGLEDGYAYVGGFARFNYKFREKYILNLTGRLDGSSRFGEDVGAGFFPSAGLGWILSEEDFLRDSRAVDFLKIRGSVGSSGNSFYGNKQADGVWRGGQRFLLRELLGRFPARFSNSDMTWERVNQANLGIDFRTLGNRITGSLDAYVRQTNDMLLDFPMTPSLGMADTVFIENGGTMHNAGVELGIQTANIIAGDFTWHTTLTVARNWNKVTDLGGFDSDAFGGFRDLRIAEDEPLGVFFLPEYAGIAQSDDPNGNYQAGDELIYDQNGNKIRPTSLAEVNSARKLITDKSPFPKIFGGFSNRFAYKGFDLTIHLTYSFGRYVLDEGERMQSFVTGKNNLRVPDDRTDNPNLYFSGAPGLDFVDPLSQVNTTRFLHSADYIRFRDVTLGYNLPQRWLQKTLVPGTDNPIVAEARLFISARNLLTITPFNGWDPESATNMTTNQARNLGMGVTAFDQPQVQSYMVGFNLTF